MSPSRAPPPQHPHPHPHPPLCCLLLLTRRLHVHGFQLLSLSRLSFLAPLPHLPLRACRQLHRHRLLPLRDLRRRLGDTEILNPPPRISAALV
ncbi:hypothetical protein KSP40_PGU000158 [Platanthera guangdongensis]|uniref:Uncharacterized protein n=1 Tax=Platanthera guangdongensis TaxID=2320717 RepID=A0ABR2LL33_9ASPA